MKRQIPAWAGVLLLAATATGFGLAAKGRSAVKALQEENRGLRGQVEQLENRPPNVRIAARAEPATERRAPRNPALAEEADADGLIRTGEPGSGQRENDRPPRESFEERMARMRAEDPDGYAEMVRARQERQQAMRYNLAERTATFLDLDTRDMSDEERANHNLLVDKMSRIWELTERFQDPEQPPDREAMGELFRAINEARPLMAMERTVLFRQLGQELGYESGDARAFARQVEEIIAATTLQMPGGGGGGPRGRPQGRQSAEGSARDL